MVIKSLTIICSMLNNKFYTLVYLLYNVYKKFNKFTAHLSNYFYYNNNNFLINKCDNK